MNKEHLKELLDHIGNEVNLLRQGKLKRRVLQAFMDLLEDKQDMVSIFDEYSKKSIEVEKQNKRYREVLEDIKMKISKQLEGLDAEEEMQRVVELSELMSMTIDALKGDKQ